MAIERELRRLLDRAQRPGDSNKPTTDPTNAPRGGGNQRDHDDVVAREIYERLRRVREQRVLPGVSVRSELHVPELLALTAETAVRQQDFAVARACVEWFLSECSMKNQFYCRVQLVRARCASNAAANDTDVARLRKVLDAIHFVLLVVPVATDPRRRPQYDFLVYNASVVYWQVARQLMKRSTFQYLLPSLTAMLDALRVVGEKDTQWLLRLQLALVHAQLDAKQLAAAAKTVGDLVDVQFAPLLNDPAQASDAAARALYEEALRLQVHVGSFKDPECQKMLATMKKGGTSKRVSLVTKLQALKSGAFAGTLEAALTEIFQEATAMASFATATTTSDEIAAYCHGLDAAALQSVDGEILAEAGIIAAFRQEYRLASCCDAVLHAKGKTLDPKCRVLHQVLKAILVALLPPSASANFKLSRAQRAELVVARRLEGVKAMERALLACKRQQDPTLMESVCLYAWNLSLPLLQPGQRDQLSRLFSLASSSLEELQSLQLNLHVRLKLELGKLELSSEFILKAQETVNKALGLDYGTVSAAATATPTLDDLTANEAKWLRRPLDVHLAPLRKRIEMKLAVDEPSSQGDELAIAVEQLRDAKDSAQRKRRLDRVLAALEGKRKEREGREIEESPLPVELLLQMNAATAVVWYEVNDLAVARALASETLELFFPAGVDQQQQQQQSNSGGGGESFFSDKSVMVLEVDLRLRLVEMLAQDMKNRSQRFDIAQAEHTAAPSGKRRQRESGVATRNATRHAKAGDDRDAAALLLLTKGSFALGLSAAPLGSAETHDASLADRRAALEADLLALKTELIQQLTMALRAATRIGWGFLVENAAVYLWNYHFHVFRLVLTASPVPPSILSECIAAFEATLAAFEALPAPACNLDLLTSVALGLALAQEKMNKLDKAAAIADAILKRHKASSATLPVPQQTVVSSIPLVLLKRFAELKVRIQIAQNAKEIQPVDATPQVRVASLLEAMEVTLGQASSGAALAPVQLAQATEKAQGFFQKALAAWQPIAKDSLDRMRNESLSLEEQHQQLELFCEIWVRLGCGAFRFRNAKQAIDCGECALEPVTQLLSESEQRVWVVEATWRWLAIADLLCARSILTLLSGETAAWTLIQAALAHLVRSTRVATRAAASGLVVKAGEVAWNAVVAAMAAVEAERALGESSEDSSETQWWTRLQPQLREVLGAVTHASGSSVLVGKLGLLVLDVCERAKDWKAAVEVAESLIQCTASASAAAEIPPDQLKEITTFHAIAVATLGDASGSGSSSGGGAGPSSKAKDHDPMMQAKIMRKVAFSSWRNPPMQLKALATALKELEARPEERALVLVEMAEWFFTHQFPSQEVEAHLDAALDILARGQLQLADATAKKKDKTSDRPPSGGGVSIAAASEPQQYCSLWFADKLVRLFTMRAVAAPSVPLRWQHVLHAVHQVHAAWQSILDVANDHDLRERFAQDAAADATSDFDAWKRTKPTKFRADGPRSASQWIAFYQQYATSTASRFYMQWIPPLLKLKESASDSRGAKQPSVSNPILSCSVLERLLRLLVSAGAFELMLPVVCLYQVVYFAFCPQRSKAMEIWIELTTYDVLEKLNLPVLSVPLQSALEMLQTSGDAILKELQQQEDDTSGAASVPTATAHHRTVLQLSCVNVSTKVAQSVELLLDFGFVRQAKVLLTMLQSLSNRVAGESESKRHCEALSTRVLEIEGDNVKAVVHIQQLIHRPTAQLELGCYTNLVLQLGDLLPDRHKAADALAEAEKAAAAAILTSSQCVQLNQPMHAQAVSKYLSSLASSIASNRPSASHHGMLIDLDAMDGLARIKFQRACVLLELSSTTPAVEHAQRVLREALELLAFTESHARRAQCCADFGLALAAHALKLRDDTQEYARAQQHEQWLVESRALLHESLVILETLRRQTSELALDDASVAAAPRDLAIAKLKLQLAKLELQLEQSAAIVSDQQMTWYTYEKEARSTIVEKWLDQTAVRAQMERPGSVGKAFVLAGAVAAMLAHACPDMVGATALARTIRLQCRRLALYHDTSVNRQGAVQRFLWTRYTSESAPHATWVCVAGKGSGSSSSGEEGRSTLVPPTTTDLAVAVEEPQDAEVHQRLLAIASELEAELTGAMEKRHDEVTRICAYELVQAYGCNQVVPCVRAFLLYQSTCVREQHMKPLVDKCLPSTNVVRLHMARLDRLAKRHTNASRNSLPFQLSQLFLDQQSDIYKRMGVSVPVESILAMLPAQSRVLSLQFSPDQCFLYAAVASNGDRCVAMARMECTLAKLQLLAVLKERIRRWRQETPKALLAFEEASSSSTDDAREFVTDTQQDASAVASSDELEAEFNAIVSDTDAFFSALFDHSALSAVLQSDLPGNSLVLIVDRELESLPLEALPALEKADAISREFSIHLLYHRLAAAKAQPFRKEDVRIIVDPRHDDAGLHDQTLSSIVHQFTKRPGAAFVNWKEAVDHGHAPTTTDWQQAMLLRRGGALLYAGANRVVGSAFSLPTLAGMNLSSSCYALLLLDCAENPSSARRQSKVDSEKPQSQRELEEDAYACALLCSLCGINTIMLNQWATTFNANRRLTNGLLSGLAKGQSIAKALRMYAETVAPVGDGPSGGPSRKASTGPAGGGGGPQPSSAARQYRLKNRIRFSTAVFGLGHLAFKANE